MSQPESGHQSAGGERLTALWTSDEVLAWLREHGRSIAASTWRAYVARQQAPQPRHIGRTALWQPDEIRAWHARRTGTDQQQR